MAKKKCRGKKCYNPRDRYYKKAKEEGYSARSVYKLQEINERYPLLHEGDAVLDLGAYPGSFAQYTRQVIGERAPLFLMDLQPLDIMHEATATWEGDCFSEEMIHWIQGHPLSPGQFDVILSDMAPKTTGIKDVDHGSSIELCERVMDVAHDFLRPGGNILMKVFVGSEYEQFLRYVKSRFKKVKPLRPDATRSSSREVFLVGFDFTPKESVRSLR